MSVPDKYLSQSRIAVALAICSPAQTAIIADIAETMAKQDVCCRQSLCEESPIAPILDYLRERYCLECGEPGPNCNCTRDE